MAKRTAGVQHGHATGVRTTTRRSWFHSVATAERFGAMATSHTHSCGINAAGSLFCWGGNVGYQLGVEDEFYMTFTPVLLSGPVFKTH
jgi:hypothetical protein